VSGSALSAHPWVLSLAIGYVGRSQINRCSFFNYLAIPPNAGFLMPSFEGSTVPALAGIDTSEIRSA
jgi:hypothetical protein